MPPSIALQFEKHRPYLFAIAYRMLGSASDAEDLLQECFIQYSKYSGKTIQNLKSFLATLVTRRGIDLLRRLQRQRTDYIGPWLPEPLAPADPLGDPAILLETESDISIALLYAMERLQPRERAVLILRDAFDYDYADIAEMLQIQYDHCRKLASRARHSVRDVRRSNRVNPEHVERLMCVFLKAARHGNLHELEALLCEDARIITDGGGKVIAALNIVYSRNHVARFVRGLARKARIDPDQSAFYMVNGRPALLIRSRSGRRQLLSIQIENNKIKAIYSVSNPDKLTRQPQRPGVLARLRSLWIYWRS